MSKKVKFAVIGCGHIGKRHAEMITRNEESELVALCDTRSKDNLNIDHFKVPFYSSIEEMLTTSNDIDVVNICTPNGLHADQSLLALQHGKHIVCEKPLGLSKAKCESIIYKALREHKHVFCVMQNRYSPPSERNKELIEN